MPMNVAKVMTNNAMYTAQDSYTFLLLAFSCSYNFHNLNSLQHRMNYHIYIHNCKGSK